MVEASGFVVSWGSAHYSLLGLCWKAEDPPGNQLSTPPGGSSFWRPFCEGESTTSPGLGNPGYVSSGLLFGIVTAVFGFATFFGVVAIVGAFWLVVWVWR